MNSKRAVLEKRSNGYSGEPVGANGYARVRRSQPMLVFFVYRPSSMSPIVEIVNPELVKLSPFLYTTH